jgi:hypothetical protein
LRPTDQQKFSHAASLFSPASLFAKFARLSKKSKKKGRTKNHGRSCKKVKNGKFWGLKCSVKTEKETL